ncbi:MAG TPA: DUF2142 domain-containing protein [Candidatus Eisenbacteria bacterium]|nr:DUF2142 domain-containing protein [Candidatus Eisenbacteria bacterium]
MQTRAAPQSEATADAPAGHQMVVRRSGRLTLRWAFAALGYGLLTVAWVFASPLGAAPDEPAHSVRAAAAGQGRWQGSPAAPYQRTPERTPAQADLLNAQAQEFTVPARLVLADPCFAGRVDQPAACAGTGASAADGSTVTAATYETTAPPEAYVIAGLAMRLPQDVLAPGYLGRLALALASALLLAGAAWAASGRGSLWPLAGLALAVTPAVLFLGAALGTAGLAAAAGLCFTTGLAAFWMDRPRRGLEALVAASGAALALASAAGALSLVALVVVVLPLARPRRLTRPAALLASAVVTAAAVAGVALALDHRPLPAGHADLLAAVPLVLSAAPGLLEQAVGVFGRWDVVLPVAAYAVWGTLVALGVAGALVLGRWRDRLALLLGLGAALGLATIAEAFVLSPVGWALSASFLLPTLGAAPILAGFVLHRARVRPRADPLLVGAAVVAIQLLAFWENARRYAVGRHGPLSFPSAALWTPPAGWLPWLVLAGAGGLLLVLALLPLWPAERDEEALGPLVVVDPAISVSR